ncbi:hypothetical protein ILUMI_20351 [Ignelater luminosus]|uniref:Uncharacterized protein n=1 Tax=Ignelater luminosus TaxID=2038154 RepID=A0A8K0G4Y6_IGNLU|nr:hypothetical protein ILUMI_20351 [Ignelater luminosus]
MTSDGWKPILGTSQREVPDEITLYRNPTLTDGDSRPIKAQPVPVQTPSPTSATRPYQTISTNTANASPPSVNINNFGAGSVPKVKIAPHAKAHPSMLMLPNHPNYGHGPHIPLTSPGHKNKSRRRPVKSKPSGKRRVKPIRGPVGAHSMKNEVYVPAPSAAIGSFAFYNQGLGNVKSQGNKHFQPQFTSPFGLSAIQGLPGSNDVIIQQVPVHTFLIQNRNPIQNVQSDNLFVNQNDEYTRNLVPPPFKFYQQEKDKQKNFKQKEQPIAAENTVNIHNPQLIIGKPKDTTRHRTVLPEGIIVQLPPPFEQQSQFGLNFNQQQKINNPQPDVQVTKEKLKVFHNSVPPNYSPGQDSFEQQYHFQTINKPIEEQKIYTFESFPAINNQKQTFRKPSTENYPTFEQPKQDIFKKQISEAPKFPTYEVTEGKQWQQGFQPFLSTRPSVPPQEPLPPQPPPRIPSPQMEFVFLPTPYTPEGSVPTSPTQSDVSSIYAELNQRNRPSPNEYSTLDPNYFSIKEVSTHYPIVGRPESSAVYSIPAGPQNAEFSNEITTMKEEKREPIQIYQIEEPEPTIPPTKPPPPREWQGQRQRPHQRRRRPTQRTRTTTTTEEPSPATESYEVHKVQSSEENYSGETQRPHRRRRPTRVRTTEATPETTKAEEITRPTIRQRYRTRYDLSRVRPTASAESIEEMPSNHKMTEAITAPGAIAASDTVNRFRQHYTTEELPVSNENEVTKSETVLEVTESDSSTDNYPKILTFGKHYRPIGSEEETSSATVRTTEKQTETPTSESSSEEQPTHSRRRLRYPSSTIPTTTTTTTAATTEQQSISSILTPENEIDYDYSTQTNHFEPSKETITIQEIYSKIPEASRTEATLATTTPPSTTTTTEASTTRSNRVRGRPVKYDNKNRPRFSVKEYRQRLSQYSSTSTETPRTTTESSRVRFPNRSRRPITLPQEEEPTTERTKFTPKEPRHGAASESTTERRTRVRNYSRFRSTTEASTTTQKVSIKPNIFSNLRRPPMVTLRQRIMNKYNRTTQEKTTEKPINEIESGSEITEHVETTLNYNVPLDSSTESDVKKIVEDETTSDETNDETENEEMANAEIMKNDSYLQSQRVADLTLAAQKEYDTPGLFKSVSPNTSRIVPNYFTISTDDPILPIEAFFPNLNKNPKSDS